MENKYSASFKIEWGYDNGPTWMNKESLQFCINAHCGQDTTCKVTEKGPVMVSGDFQDPSNNANKTNQGNKMDDTITINTKKCSGLENITVKNDTLVKIEGMPFILPAGSTMLGRHDNMDAAIKARRDYPCSTHNDHEHATGYHFPGRCECVDLETNEINNIIMAARAVVGFRGHIDSSDFNKRLVCLQDFIDTYDETEEDKRNRVQQADEIKIDNG